MKEPIALFVMYNDNDLIPSELASRSISSREIVLPYGDAMKAINHLAQAGYVILCWEGWLKFADKGVTHSQHQGTRPFYRAKGQTAQQYIRAAADFAQKTIEAAQRLFDDQPEHPDTELYFCLSVIKPRLEQIEP